MNVYLKGGPMHGEMVEVDVKKEGIHDVYPPHIRVCKMPEVHFNTKQRLTGIINDIDYEELHYKLVIEHKGIPYYEHLQSTS